MKIYYTGDSKSWIGGKQHNNYISRNWGDTGAFSVTFSRSWFHSYNYNLGNSRGYLLQ